jgi:hypothetical protein
MITKFAIASTPSFVRVDVFRVVNGVDELGYWVTIGSNEYKLTEGDYIIQDDNGIPVAIITAAEYVGDLVKQALVREQVGLDLRRAIWAALRAGNIPDAQKGGIATTINTPVDLTRDGEIVAARALAAATATNANYTAGVRTQLLAIMDAAITKL